MYWQDDDGRWCAQREDGPVVRCRSKQVAMDYVAAAELGLEERVSARTGNIVLTPKEERPHARNHTTR